MVNGLPRREQLEGFCDECGGRLGQRGFELFQRGQPAPNGRWKVNSLEDPREATSGIPDLAERFQLCSVASRTLARTTLETGRGVHRVSGFATNELVTFYQFVSGSVGHNPRSTNGSASPLKQWETPVGARRHRTGPVLSTGPPPGTPHPRIGGGCPETRQGSRSSWSDSGDHLPPRAYVLHQRTIHRDLRSSSDGCWNSWPNRRWGHISGGNSLTQGR